MSSKFYFTPGPTQMHPRFFEFMDEAASRDIFSITHRGKDFEDLYQHTQQQLRLLMNIPDDYRIFFVASGTEAMERIIQNLVSEKSFHFVNGSFSNRFYEISKALENQPAKYEVPFGEGFFRTIENVKPSLEQSELLCFTKNETSSGVMTPMSFIHKIKRLHPDKLIAVDMVSAAPYDEVDFSIIDAAFFSIQKGFCLPAGLGVIILNPRCLQKARFVISRKYGLGSYHSFLSLAEKDEKHQTPETPNVLAIYLLGKVCEAYNKYGIDRIREETLKKAQTLYDYFDSHSSWSSFVEEKSIRSKTVITADIGESCSDLLAFLEAKDIIVGQGYGKFQDQHIRIANFPCHSLDEMTRLLDAIKEF